VLVLRPLPPPLQQRPLPPLLLPPLLLPLKPQRSPRGARRAVLGTFGVVWRRAPCASG